MGSSNSTISSNPIYIKSDYANTIEPIDNVVYNTRRLSKHFFVHSFGKLYILEVKQSNESLYLYIHDVDNNAKILFNVFKLDIHLPNIYQYVQVTQNYENSELISIPTSDKMHIYNVQDIINQLHNDDDLLSCSESNNSMGSVKYITKIISPKYRFKLKNIVNNDLSLHKCMLFNKKFIVIYKESTHYSKIITFNFDITAAGVLIADCRHICISANGKYILRGSFVNDKSNTLFNIVSTDNILNSDSDASSPEIVAGCKNISIADTINYDTMTISNCGTIVTGITTCNKLIIVRIINGTVQNYVYSTDIMNANNLACSIIDMGLIYENWAIKKSDRKHIKSEIKSYCVVIRNNDNLHTHIIPLTELNNYDKDKFTIVANNGKLYTSSNKSDKSIQSTKPAEVRSINMYKYIVQSGDDIQLFNTNNLYTLELINGMLNIINVTLKKKHVSEFNSMNILNDRGDMLYNVPCDDWICSFIDTNITVTHTDVDFFKTKKTAFNGEEDSALLLGFKLFIMLLQNHHSIESTESVESNGVTKLDGLAELFRNSEIPINLLTDIYDLQNNKIINISKVCGFINKITDIVIKHIEHSRLNPANNDINMLKYYTECIITKIALCHISGKNTTKKIQKLIGVFRLLSQNRLFFINAVKTIHEIDITTYV